MQTAFLLLIKPLSLKWGRFFVLNARVHLWTASLFLFLIAAKEKHNMLPFVCTDVSVQFCFEQQRLNDSNSLLISNLPFNSKYNLVLVLC